MGTLGALVLGAILLVAILPRAGEVGNAIERVGAERFALCVALNFIALLLKTTAWGVALIAAGGRLRRSEVHPSAAVGFTVQLLNPYLGLAARVALIRRLAPQRSPTPGQLVATETALLLIDGVLAAILIVAASWTLEIPIALVVLASIAGLAIAVGLPIAARRFGSDGIARGLAVAADHRTLALTTLLLIGALAAQLARTAVALFGVGLDPDPLVIAAVVVLAGAGPALPVGTAATGAAAALLAAPGGGVAEAAAAGVVLSGSLVASCLLYLVLSPIPLLVQRRLGPESKGGPPR